MASATSPGYWADVKTDYDPSMKFTTYKTFAMSLDTKIPDDMLAQDDIVRKRVINSIETQLIKNGMVKATNPADADLTVVTYAGVKSQVNYSTVSTGYGGMYGYGGYWGGAGYNTQVIANTYREGTLHIDMFDTKQRLLAWRGQAAGALQGARTPKERQEIIDAVVYDILKGFPPNQ
ncbi:MAG: DUF4136 domain-containing protein [Candidatus Kapabacteria bacterium]|nr:DUF4136 domain-containing protein [Candidatus Kapabacteria bacterium]